MCFVCFGHWLSRRDIVRAVIGKRFCLNSGVALVKSALMWTVGTITGIDRALAGCNVTASYRALKYRQRRDRRVKGDLMSGLVDPSETKEAALAYLSMLQGSSERTADREVARTLW